MKNKILFLFFLIFSNQAFAQGQDAAQNPLPLSFTGDDLSKKRFTNRLVLDLNLNDNYESTNSKNEYRETFARARFYSKFDLGNNFSLNSQINLSPFIKADETNRRNASSGGGGDRSFEDQGIFLRQLNLQYDNKKYAFIAGKFNLNYGKAWNWNRGIWSYELANNYRQVDKIGFGGIYRAGDAKKTGQYNFGLSFFKNDRKYLANALITRDNQFSKSDAKAGDDGVMQSYVGSLDVKFDFGQKEKLTYHFAYINLAVNKRFSQFAQNKIADQKGFVASMNYIYPVRENYDIDALIEYNQFKNIDGNSDANENYFTANAINRFYDNWLVTLSYSKRFSKVVEQSRLNQQLSEISFGYEFKKNDFFDRFIIQTGYKNMRNNYYNSLEDNNSIGVLARYYKNF
jgi:hypothetical protein